jgi:hypothetical protein
MTHQLYMSFPVKTARTQKMNFCAIRKTALKDVNEYWLDILVSSHQATTYLLGPFQPVAA